MFNLKWLRVSISFKVFSSISISLVNSDTTRKVWAGIDCLDKMTRSCNCRAKTGDGFCFYGGQCRTSNIIYMYTCLTTGKVYLGNTCRHGKIRCGEHCGDVKTQFLGQKKDSFSEHFLKIWIKTFGSEIVPSRVKVRELFRYDTLWIGNNVQLNRTFGTNRCALCAKERMKILNISNCLRDMSKLINYKSEVYFGCRHKPQFLRFTKII